ncbi:Ribonucleases P/MRP protein subunit pop1 [Tolypocladium ophioglossoides CBS 100239]|uniref:Ribonucleases P/MRP protein subunit pop1 n=1 Tax=Tolypocladium ophioglossoides (strain CBS 100239) TaxID=1163406 RepID=A0A0L0N1X2_TOLOC|nr:Ribonucleases P/MRP protein subunit pop1 [Tolypocladium ophioglossoides CBS 100239]
MGPKPAGGSSSGGAASKKRNVRSPAAAGDAFRQKRAKTFSARSIPAQPADAALKDGELDLQAFVSAHEFEIRSLEQSMATSKAVPRGLRRRTASHNPKRVPRRLRARAKREMAEDNTPMVEARKRKPRTTRARIRAETAKRLGILAARKRRKQLQLAEAAQQDGKEPIDEGVIGRKPRPKIRRNQLNDPPKPTAKFRKRQLSKTWLPTHPWHAKRARMTEPKNPLWRFAIPLTPNEKIYRPTHRSQGERGTMLWDMSYTSTIGLYGNPIGMERVLKRVGVSRETCWNDKGKRWRTGTRTWSGMMSREKDGGRRLLCPATVLWNPEQPGLEENENQRKVQRQVYLRVHPSAFLEVFNELLRLTKMENPRLYIEDLRFEIGSIELTGPASTEALLAVLTPYTAKDTPKSTHAQLFESLRGLTNPAALPANAVLHFSVQDPRLRYPPRKVAFPDDPQAQMGLLETMAKWPAEDGLEPSSLFDRDARHRASCLPSQKFINRRRGGAAPGSFLKPAKVDPPIPVILMASRLASSTQTQGTWTLLAPWKCILPMWYSMVHVPLVSGLNPRFAGMDETMQVAFERGLPWFPADYLGTDAGAEWELEQRRKRKREWERRPKSKRTEWSALDLGAGRKGEVGDGLSCDFELLFGLPRPQEDQTLSGDSASDDAGNAMDVDKAERQPAKQHDEPPSLKLLSPVSKATFDSLVASPALPPPALPNAILNVRISVLARGVATTCARIYRLPSTPSPAPISPSAEVPATMPPQDADSASLPHDLRSQWLARAPCCSTTASSNRSKRAKMAKPTDTEARKRLLARELIAPPAPYPPPAPNQGDIGGHPLVPDAKDLIGFVTTGSFCLSHGHGAAMGSVALEKVLADVRSDGKEGRLCIVRNAGENVGWIARWEVVI